MERGTKGCFDIGCLQGVKLQNILRGSKTFHLTETEISNSKQFQEITETDKVHKGPPSSRIHTARITLRKAVLLRKAALLRRSSEKVA